MKLRRPHSETGRVWKPLSLLSRPSTKGLKLSLSILVPGSGDSITLVQ